MTIDVLATEAGAAEHLAEFPTEIDDAARTKHLSRRALLLRRFLRNKTAVVGVFMYLFLIVLAIFGPKVLTEWNYTELDQTAFLQGPSWSHKLGTTQAGRDVLAMSLQGLRVSMLISLVVGLGATTVAAIVGSFAAYFGGWLERVSLWTIDLLLVLPAFLIIALFMRNINSNLAIWLAFWLMFLSWMLSARIVRSLTMSVRDREYVTAAKYMGVRGPTIIVRHILPNVASLLIIDATLAIAAAVIAETSLSFFGFGIRSPEVSLGTVIAEGVADGDDVPVGLRRRRWVPRVHGAGHQLHRRRSA